MGLDFSHCNAHWAYSGFMRFGTRLAAEVGIALHCMESFAWNFSTDKPYKSVRVNGYNESVSNDGCLIGIQPVIKWSAVNDDIVPLLNHSDCEDDLTPDECRKVAPRLRELVEQWADDDRDKINALLLAEGMEEAASREENLKFR